VVPRWPRRYCWGQSDIERLVEDLLTIAAADSSATHYGGTLLTFQDPGAAGVVRTIRVVDGQQRLTTVSILLASIARELGAKTFAAKRGVYLKSSIGMTRSIASEREWDESALERRADDLAPGARSLALGRPVGAAA